MSPRFVLFLYNLVLGFCLGVGIVIVTEASEAAATTAIIVLAGPILALTLLIIDHRE